VTDKCLCFCVCLFLFFPISFGLMSFLITSSQVLSVDVSVLLPLGFGKRIWMGT
jgi:hypothetical protein